MYPNRLRKATPSNESPRFASRASVWGSSPSGSPRALAEPRVLRRPPQQSRTMAFARQMDDGDSGRTVHPVPHRAPVASPYGDRTASAHGTPPTESLNAAPKAINTPPTEPGRSTPSEAQGGRELVLHDSTYLSRFQDCLYYPALAVSRSVSAIEHQWAMRAARAEALLDAHAARRQELSALSASMEERRARDLAELNARYSQEFERHRNMVWVSLGVIGSLVAFLLYKLLPCTPAAGAGSSRWLGPVHFTIPVLSPFASVIEHETSAVNVPLVATLLTGAGILAFLWYNCACWRR